MGTVAQPPKREGMVVDSCGQCIVGILALRKVEGGGTSGMNLVQVMVISYRINGIANRSRTVFEACKLQIFQNEYILTA